MDEIEQTIPCIWCGTPTTYTGTKHCDPCYELDKRISDNPELAARIAGYYSVLKSISQNKMVSDVLAGIKKANADFNRNLAGYLNHQGEFIPFFKENEK